MNRSDPGTRSFSPEQLRAAIGDVGGPARPNYLSDIVGHAGRTRQRPRWTFLGGWVSGDVAVRRQGVPHVAVVFASVLLLIALLAAGIALVGSYLNQPSPSPGLRSEAEQIVAEGDLDSSATVGEMVLTVWETCRDFGDTSCGYAWRLSTGSHTQATGLVAHGDGSCCTRVDAVASGDGFIVMRLNGAAPLAVHIAPDGTATSISLGCRNANWSTPTEPGRLALVQGHVVDTVAGTACETEALGGRPLGASGAFTADGILWYLLDNDPDRPDTLTIGRYDGRQWRYHDFAAQAGHSTSVLAVAGSSVGVLLAAVEPSPQADQLVGLAVTTDGGATWSEVVDPDVLRRNLPFALSPNDDDLLSGYTKMAFAGSDVLYVADWRGDLWRSTDFVRFSLVSVPGAVQDLQADGDGVIAAIDGGKVCGDHTGCGGGTVRISADGAVGPMTTR
jgi:hypothetical protein